MEQICRYRNTSIEEIKAGIGMTIMMDIYLLPHLENFWHNKPVLGGLSIVHTMLSIRQKCRNYSYKQ